MNHHINVIGAGLAGSEAAWQIANRGIPVKLHEMKPTMHSPAHKIDTFAELVCTNSFRSDQLENAVGLLKEEMRQLNSIIMQCGDQWRVPAGGAMAVDREKFSESVTQRLRSHPMIEVCAGEVQSIPTDAITVIATGPLTSDALSQSIQTLLGAAYLHFFDASAPIVTYESVDMTKAFKASRYGKGEDDYINCPMEKEEYLAFYEALTTAEAVHLKDFEDDAVFEGCMPVEVMAKRGVDTMRFGPLKPVGLVNPHTGQEPYAVVQLRQDNSEGSLYNIVGFQTHLKWPEQRRVFGMIPGLAEAEFIRFGVMHRNTYIQSPGNLNATYQLIQHPNIFFAGQITGVEGYVESASSGIVAGLNAARRFHGQAPLVFPKKTAIGALGHYISDVSVRNFQPMNVNFGIMEKWEGKIKNKREKNMQISKRGLESLSEILNAAKEIDDIKN